jgi:hypothetical protein
MTQWEIIRNKLGGKIQGGLIFGGNVLINFVCPLGKLKVLVFAIYLKKLNCTRKLDIVD